MILRRGWIRQSVPDESGDRVDDHLAAVRAGDPRRMPATGKHAEWLGVGICTVGGGKVTEAWFADILSMLL
jgi:hypothetical protein